MVILRLRQKHTVFHSSFSPLILHIRFLILYYESLRDSTVIQFKLNKYCFNHKLYSFHRGKIMIYFTHYIVDIFFPVNNYPHDFADLFRKRIP